MPVIRFPIRVVDSQFGYRFVIRRPTR